MVVCIQGSVHQGSNCFSNMTRGRQCAFMSLSALMFSHCLPVQIWTSTNIDQILYYGDLMYVDAFQSNRIPDKETLLIDELPNVFVGPAGLNYEVSYHHFFQELVLGCPDPQFPNVFGIHEALQNALFLSNDIILILSGYMIPIKAVIGLFYMFNSHARSASGLPDAINGKAVLLMFDTLQELELHILSLSDAVDIMQFEVVPITFSVIHCHNQQSLEQRETFRKNQEHLPDQLTEKESVPKPACHPDTKQHILKFLSKKEVTIEMTQTAG